MRVFLRKPIALLVWLSLLTPQGWGQDPFQITAEAQKPTTDRAGAQNGASAAAMAAAAMAQLSCIQMMKEAQETGDKKLMLMAMQMCAQAAALMANSQQNKEGASKITSGSAAASTASPQPKEARIDTNPKSDDFNLDIKADDKVTNSESNTSLPSFAANNASSESDPVLTKDKTFSGEVTPVPLASGSAPASSNLTVNESSGGTGNSVAGIPGSLVNSGFNRLNQLGNSSSSVTSTADSDSKKKMGKGPNGASSSGDSAGSSPEGEGSAFDNFMARMMGGGANNSTTASLGGGLVDLAYGLQGSANQRPLTIFEFASSQYQKAKTERGALQKFSSSSKASISRGIASE
jgi:hypothetical protein